MPTLKQLTCRVESSEASVPFDEYHTKYGDGSVETYIAVPKSQSPFAVSLKSSGYIAPGLAMFVFMDGVYQCNRNRNNLLVPNQHRVRKQTEVRFRVRQKEESIPDGFFRGKQWRFERFNVASDPNVDWDQRAPHNGEYVGTIEVVVLRCYAAPPLFTLPPLSSESESEEGPYVGVSASSSDVDEEVPQVGFSVSYDTDDDDELPPFGAMFDGAGESRPVRPRLDRTYDDPGTKASSRRHGVAKPEADDSNVRENKKHSPPELRGANSFASRRSNHSDWDSTEQHAQFERGRSSKQRLLPNQYDSPNLTLRGGAPGSYTPSPDQGNPGAWQNPSESSTKAVVDENWKPNPSAWDQPSEQRVENKSWEPATNDNEQRNAWGEKISDVEATAWDAPKENTAGDGDGWGNTNNSQQTGTWGTAANDDNQPQNGSWNAGNEDGQQQNQSWNSGNGDNQGNSSWNAGGGDWNQDAGATGTHTDAWNTGNLGDNGNNNWGAPQNEEPEATSGAKEPQKETESKNPKGVKSVSKGKGYKRVQIESVPNADLSGLPGHYSPPLTRSKKKTPSPTAAVPKAPSPSGTPYPQDPGTPKVKAYWSRWQAPEDPDEPIVEAPKSEDPVYTIPASLANRKNTTHQVLPMRGHIYTHRLGTPEYMDTHEDPYAVFVFKYREKAVIERMGKVFDINITDEEKKRLEGLSKQEVIEELIRETSRSGSRSEDGEQHTWNSDPTAAGLSRTDLDRVNEKLRPFEGRGSDDATVGGAERNSVRDPWGKSLQGQSPKGSSPQTRDPWGKSPQGPSPKGSSPQTRNSKTASPQMPGAWATSAPPTATWEPWDQKGRDRDEKNDVGGKGGDNGNGGGWKNDSNNTGGSWADNGNSAANGSAWNQNNDAAQGSWNNNNDNAANGSSWNHNDNNNSAQDSSWSNNHTTTQDVQNPTWNNNNSPQTQTWDTANNNNNNGGSANAGNGGGWTSNSWQAEGGGGGGASGDNGGGSTQW